MFLDISIICYVPWIYLGDRGESSQSGESHFGNHGRGKGQGGHPPWLKGKQIGLYYRDKAREMKQKSTKVIKLSEHVQVQIERVLYNSKGYYEKLYNNAYAEDTLHGTLENKYMHIHDSQFKRKFMNMVSGNLHENLDRALLVKSRLERDSDLDKMLFNEFKVKTATQEYQSMEKIRLKLPAHHKKVDILRLLKTNQVIVISGETGKFLLFVLKFGSK